jgi:hypothetical protein
VFVTAQKTIPVIDAMIRCIEFEKAVLTTGQNKLKIFNFFFVFFLGLTNKKY